MSWQESVERVLWMRRVARLKAEKAELIEIIQETERRCKVVVNRQQSEVLKDVPSWKSSQPGAAVPHESGKPRSFRRGMRTWGEQRKRLEKSHRKEADRRERRQEEFEQVLKGEFGAQAGAPAVHTNTEEISDVEYEQPAEN